MTKIATVPGQIVDATPHRILYVTSADVDIFNIDDGQTTTLQLPDGHRPSPYGRLIEGGALVGALITDPPGATYELDEFRNGQLTQLGPTTSVDSLATAGNFALWSNGQTLIRRDLPAGQNEIVATNASPGANDVASNGDVAWFTYHNFSDAPVVWLWRNGTSTQISHEPAQSPQLWARFPVTDGVNIVYRITTHNNVDPEPFSLKFSDGQTEAALGGTRTDRAEGDPRLWYRATNGWIAYTGRPDAGAMQIWTRDPQGSLTQVSSDGGDFIRGLNPTGQVMYAKGSPSPQLGHTTYLAAPGETPFKIGQDEAGGFWSDGHWYVTVGGELWRVDTDSAITARPPDIVADRAADFSFTSTAQDVSYRCRLDQGDWEDNCTSPKHYADVPDGPHTFAVEATDQATGETDPSPATADWTVDLNSPGPFELLTPADEELTNNPGPLLKWTAADGANEYVVYFDDRPPPRPTSNTFFAPDFVSEGRHTWRIVARDEVGNERSSPTRAFTVDSRRPAGFSLTTPALTASARPEISWAPSSDDGSGLAGYDVLIDADTFHVGPDATTFTPSADLSDGVHELKMTAFDRAGNSTPAGSRTMRVDTTSPTAVDLTFPDDGVATRFVRQRLTWDGGTDDGSGIRDHEVWIDGARVATLLDSQSFTPGSDLSQGSHTWRIVATDRAGNERSSPTRTFTVDSFSPHAFSVTAPAVSADPRPEISWTPSADDGSGLLRYEVTLESGAASSVGPDVTSFRPNTDLSDGRHTFRVTAFDRAGNWSEAFPQVVRVDTVAPSVIDLTAPDDGAALATARPQLAWTGGTDVGIRDHEVWVDGARAATLPADRTFTPSADLGQGRHTWRIVATDLAGHERASETRSFAVDTIAPAAFALTGPGDGAYLTDPRPVLSWDAASDDAGVTGYEVSIDGTRVATTTATTWRPPSDLAQGRHTWRIRALDAAGNGRDSAERSFLVDTVAPVPAFTITPSPALTDQEVTFDAGASRDDVGPIVHYEWDLDGNGSYETDTGAGAVAHRTYGDPASPSISLRVTDAAGHSATLTRSQSVTPAPLPGPAGVSINDGARFTNDRDVTITAVWPAFATTMLVSNDGGFADAIRRAVTAHVDWRLDSEGSERLPKTVYVRFLGGLVGNQTYQDDIILDTSAPTVASATIERTASVRRSGPALRTYILRVKARDRISGVKTIRLASNRKKPGAKIRYAHAVRITARRAPKWVRAADGAGNPSKWRRLKWRRSTTAPR